MEPSDLPLAEKHRQRFLSKVVVAVDGCWLWTAGTDQHGYGTFFLRREAGRQVFAKAHRIAWESVNGPVPAGLELDHAVCERPSCVNPAHLEAVTHRVNSLRGRSPSAQAHRAGRCLAGHDMAGTNVYVKADGDRECRECRNERSRAWRASR